jgi:acyl-CoA thioester hydrolase
MRWADLDSLNHVNNVVYLDYAAETRALLEADGVLDAAPTGRITVEFLRPLLLSRRPVTVSSVLDGATLEQEVCVDRDGRRTVFARVTTLLDRAEQPEAAPAVDVLPSRVRRSDLGSSDAVTPVKMFELFQEARILFMGTRMPTFSAGGFVVAHVDVVLVAPVRWRRQPYDARSWISRVGDSSVRIETQLADGDAVLAHSTSVLVGFDLETQRSRRLSGEERAAVQTEVRSA